MRITGAAVAILALSLSTSGLAQHQHGTTPAAEPSGGVQVAGWEARLDRANQSVDNLSFVQMGAGLHVTTGPAAIFWKPDQTASGSYSVKATFWMPKPPARAEGYGLFVGGADLKGDGQKYTYFLIRHDGKVIVKRRNGAQVDTLLDWTEQAAVNKPDATGRISNEMTITVTASTVTFSVNGKDVHSQPASTVDTSGIAGLRVNHGLDVHVDGWSIQKQS